MLFGHHPSDVGGVRSAAHQAAQSAHEYSRVADDLRSRRTAVASNAEGALIVEPMLDLIETTAKSAIELAGAALLAEGAFTTWADAVEVFNRTVDELNAQYEMAAAMRFGIGPEPEPSDGTSARAAKDAYAQRVVAARSALNHELTVRHEQAEDQLNDIAATIAGTLDRGPSAQSLAFYAASGGLRDSAAYAKHDRSSNPKLFNPSATDFAALVTSLSAGVARKLTERALAKGVTAAVSLGDFMETMNANEVLTEPGSTWWEEYRADYKVQSTAISDAADKTERLGKTATRLETVEKYGGPTLLGVGVFLDHYVGHESWGKAITADTTGYVVGIAASNAGEAGAVALGEGVTGLFAATATGAAAGSVVPVAGTIAGAVVGLVVGVVATGIVKKHWKGITHGLDDAVTSGEHLLGDTAHAAASGWKHLWD